MNTTAAIGWFGPKVLRAVLPVGELGRGGSQRLRAHAIMPQLANGKAHPMAKNQETLESLVGPSLRRSVAAQGRAYAEYGKLLGAFADKKMKATDFGRKALDLYIGAVSDAVSAGVDIAGKTLQIGLDRFSNERVKAEILINEMAKPPRPRKRAVLKRTTAKAAVPKTPTNATKTTD